MNFNVPPFVGKELDYIKDAINNQKICGDGKYTKLCSKWIENKTGAIKALLTTSCTSAIELAAYLLNIKEGDEVICPSFTFVSSANPFVLRGAKIIFVDIRPDTMNIDENKIEAAITHKTKAIIVVHYAGVACEMDKIMGISKKYNIPVIEDAAQAVMSSYKGVALGTFGRFGCFSFHETKNYSMGEGGAILINDERDILRSEVIREKGTNRSQYHRGQIDKYTWQDIGSSILPSDILAAYLWAQLEKADEINNDRLNSWSLYYKELSHLKNIIDLPIIPEDCIHNAHMFYIKCKDIQERSALISYLKEKNIMAVFHYIPLHSSPAGTKFGYFSNKDEFTTKESERLLRLPLYYGLKANQIKEVCIFIEKFYRGK